MVGILHSNVNVLDSTESLTYKWLKWKKNNVYFQERERGRGGERQPEWGGGRDRETQNLKQAPGSELSAQSPM